MKKTLTALAAATAVTVSLAAPAAHAAQILPVRKNIPVTAAVLYVNQMPQICDKKPCSENRRDVLSLTLAASKSGCFTDVKVRQARSGSTLTVAVTGTPTNKPCARALTTRLSIPKGVTTVVDSTTRLPVDLTTSITR